ncbi:MAG: arginine--tRNA ligase [Deltaproteobacteria bacterium]
MKSDIQKALARSLESLKLQFPSIAVTPDEIEIEIPKRREFGDFSSNIALALAKSIGQRPRELAELIIKNLPQNGAPLFKKTEIAGAGFINFHVSESALAQKLTQIEALGADFGKSDFGGGKRILVEFVSANPTGYLHIGHARNAAVGDAVSNILAAAGFGVTREFYINDAGRQMEMLGLSVFTRYSELCGIERAMPEDGYQGDYVREIAEEIHGERGDALIAEGEVAAVSLCREFARRRLIAQIELDLADFGVRFDEWYGESERIHKPLAGGANKLDGAVSQLDTRGALERRDEALWFKATDFGDTQDWVLVKRDASPTYFLADIAYHADKMRRPFDGLVNVWGADHHSHVGRLKAAMRALGFHHDALRVLLIQFVRLIRDGREVAMSKRAGSYVTLREVIREVGRDVMRFFLLMRSSDAHLDFDLDLAKRESSENPVYYVQYAHARVGSIFEKSSERGLAPSMRHLHLLTLPEEVNLIKKLISFPETVAESAQMLAPHRIAFYLQDVASDFHVYYAKNRIVGEDAELASARLYFIDCIRTVIKNGLKLLGVSAPERM